jgi:hypothetical protein
MTPHGCKKWVREPWTGIELEVIDEEEDLVISIN